MQYVPAEPVLQQLRLMGKTDREMTPEIKETAEFKEVRCGAQRASSPRSRARTYAAAAAARRSSS